MASEYYRAFDANLNNKDILKAETELNECEESKRKELQKLKELIEDEQNLVTRTDDEFLLRFLRPKKFKVDIAFKLLKNYYRYRAKNQDVYGNLCPQDLEHVFNLNLIAPLTHRDEEGRAVLILRVGAAHPDVVSFYDGFRSSVLCLEKLMESEVTQINGIVILLDLKGFQLAHMKILTSPSVIFKCSTFVQDSFPMRLKGVHVVNGPAIFDIVFTIFKPFLKEKIKTRFHFHRSDMKSLHSYIPSSLLPEEYEGKLGSMNSSSWYRELEEWQPSFKAYLNNFGYDVKRTSETNN